MRIAALLVVFCCSFAPAAHAADWELLPVPDVWKKSLGAGKAGGEGFSWYRCLIEVPQSWKGQNLELFVEPVDDAREVFLNGVKVGTAGVFPPDFRSGLGGESRHQVPSRVVLPGRANLLAVRVYRKQGRSGFNVAAPVLFGPGEAIRCEGKWQAQPGDDVAWTGYDGDAKKFGDAVYADVVDAEQANRDLRRLKGDDGPLSLAESLQRFRTPADLAIELAVAEPHIGQPLSIKFDERGRLWVLNYLQYPNPAGLKMISRDKYLRTVYDKVPPAPPNHFRGKDRITIHDDTDGDGQFDSHKTFVDGLSLASSFVRGRGGVWVLNPPYLLFYPDENQDDVPDGDPVVHLEGFGIEDSHSIANSLRWGPDGWLYAAQGSTVSGNIRRPGEKKAKPVYSMGQLIWRYHPESQRYEIFAEGGGNTFGVEIDSKGRIFSGHNGGNTRGFHYVQGGYYRKGFGKHGELSNPFAFGYFPSMPHHSVPRFTHTYIIYEGGAMSGQYDGRLFGVGPLQSHVVYSQIDPAGSTFKTKDLGHPITTTDSWFRPVDIQVGPDGGIYVADFYEQRIDHASHYQGRVHTQSGRVYRLKMAGAPRLESFDFSRLPSAELAGLLSHGNKWHRQTALRLLADRREQPVVPLLRQMLAESTGQLALEALWALNLSGGLDDESAIKLLKHDDPHVRTWVVRLACGDGRVSRDFLERLAATAGAEPNAEVQCQLACSARRLPAADMVAIVRPLVTRDNVASDPYTPLLVWWAVEAHCAADAETVLTLFDDARLWDQPLVRDQLVERLMRRFALAGTRRDLLACARLLKMAPSAAHGSRLLAGLEKALEGRSSVAFPAELSAAVAEVGGGSLELRLRQGDTRAIDEAIVIVGDAKKPKKQRLALMRMFAQLDAAGSIPVLLDVAGGSKDAEIQSAALHALGRYNEDAIGAAIVKMHERLQGDVLEIAHGILASRAKWATQLLQAVEAGQIARDRIPAGIVRKILLHDNKTIAALVRAQWGEIQGATTEQMRQQVERYSNVIEAASGNPYQGKVLYSQSCGKCHQLFTQGGKIGPNLTTYKRTDLPGILLHVVNPSAEIREGYENYVVILDDGRTLNGFIEDQDNQVVVVKGVDGQSTVIPRDEIDDMTAIRRSIMPEGLLNKLSDQQVRDLFAYLRSSQPLP